jgi:hypothetical protein
VTLKRIMAWSSAVVFFGGLLTGASYWCFHIDAQAQESKEHRERDLPDIRASLQAIAEKLEHEELKIEHERHLCRCGKISDQEYCLSIGAEITGGED